MTRLPPAEHVVLHTLQRIGSGYGLQIVALAQQLSSTFGARGSFSDIKPSGIYVLLHRMQRKALVRSEHVDPVAGERGPPRRVYYLTELGDKTLRACEAYEAAMVG